ncbi:MAG: hypothetical protein Kow002_08290 [Anaerolineales bacterium]
MQQKGPAIALTIIMLTMFGCNLLTQQGTETQAPEAGGAPFETVQTEPAQAENPDQGLCANPYYPVRPGATWTYTGTGSLASDYSFTDTITDVRTDGFTLTSQFDELTRTQEWACTPEGLASLTFGGGPAAGINVNEMQFDLTTSNVQGIILPQTINAGDQWSYSLDFEGTMDVTGASANATGTAHYDFTALGEESLTVPAGTFNAMKIKAVLTLNIKVSYAGTETPVSLTSTTDIWFVPGVGWVKAISTGQFMGQQTDDTIELQSYNIP